MELLPIGTDQLWISPHDLLANRSLLLTCGDFSTQQFNTMTIAWGSIGYMWEKPFVQVVVRPTRYTFEFMEKYKFFTLSAFPLKFGPVLNFLGSHSGRDCNKIKESGLTPVASSKIDAPTFQEAELVFECKKIYWNDFHPEHFLDPDIGKLYPKKDYHRMYFGEIVVVRGIKAYHKE